MVGVIIKYSEFYIKKIPNYPINLIKHLPKTELIVTISRINSLLNPQNSNGIDNSFETQIECVKTITDQDQNLKTYNYKSVEKYYKKHFSENHILFTRTTCLYALNEIISSNVFLKEIKTTYLPEERMGIFEYLLVCNEIFLNLSEKYSPNELEKQGVDFFEFSAFNGLPFNQYLLNENPLTTFYRSWFLFTKIQNNVIFSEHFNNYTLEEFGTKDIQELFKIFVYNYFFSFDMNLKINYLNIPKKEKIVINILNSFSNPIQQKNIDHKNIKTLDFLTLKKNPLFRINLKNKSEFESYIILDTKMLLNKVYSLFFNDFWFDYLKIKTEYKRSDWGSFIGTHYFENIIFEIIDFSFKNNPSYTIKKYDELKLKYKGNNLIEVADIYISKRQKVFLAEVKSNYINMVDGYKSVTDIKSFLKLDLNSFYEKFGLEQLVTKTINDFHSYKHLLNDKSLNLDRKVHIYPAIIVNEDILTSGTFSFILRNKFDSLMNEHNISKKNKVQLIKPLLVISIEQLQELEQSFSENSLDFFNFLDAYYQKIRIKKCLFSNKYDILTNITHMIKRKVENKKHFPNRLRKFEWIGIEK